MVEYELFNACLKLMRDMFMLQPGETIAITCDTLSDMDVVNATAEAAVAVGAKPLVMKIAAPRADGKGGDIDHPQKALIDGIKACDAWVEYNGKWIFYSTTYDKITEDENTRPRYMCLVGVNPEFMVRNIGKVDNVKLGNFILKMEAATKAAKHMRVTSPGGTDVEFDNMPGREFLTADGFCRPHEIKMMTGQIAWAPKLETINGTLVIDGSQCPPIGLCTTPIKITVKNGAVEKIEGGSEAAAFEAWLKSFDDPQMLKVAHLAYGFGPNALLTGDVVEDERVWGGTEWGFGNVGAVLTIPDIPGGIPGASHSDGIIMNCSVWLDDVQILDEGKIVGPNEEIIELARALGK